jgi:uncharacterized protein (DUF433 family)
MAIQKAAARAHREPWLKRLYLPAYGVSEAARLAQIHRTTVSCWYYGRIKPRGERGDRVLDERERGTPLSYLQLVEVAFVATLRKMGVQLGRIRIARDYLAKRFDTDYPFAQLELKTDGARVLNDLKEEQGRWVGRLLLEEASAHGQVIWVEPILDRIRQFEYHEDSGWAIRWFPRGKDGPIVVDPQIQFGAPILKDYGLPTMVIRERYQVGEKPEEIEQDFVGITSLAILQALEFEGIAAVAAA